MHAPPFSEPAFPDPASSSLRSGLQLKTAWLGTVQLLVILAVGVGSMATALPVQAQPNLFNIQFAPEDVEAGDLFACALALSDERTLVVGSVLDDDRGTDSGSLYVFRRRGGVFLETAKLLAADGGPGHRLGFSVAIDPTGARLAAGAIFHDAAGENAGAAYVFRREGGAWLQEARLIPQTGDGGGGGDGVGPFDQLGHSVALSGDVLAAGAPGDDQRADAAGAVYVFERDAQGEPGSWSLAAKLTAGMGAAPGDPAGNVGDGLGFAVALEGDTLLAGAPFADDGLGAVHVFTRGPGGWQEVQRLVAPRDAPQGAPQRRPGALFGAAVALDGERAVIGARLAEGAGERAGAAWAFRRVAGVWEMEGRLPAPDQAAGDEFGVSVALDGDALAVGARFADRGAENAGAVYRYRRRGDIWRLERRLEAFAPGEGDELGFAVAVEDQKLEGDDLVVAGAYRADSEAGPDSGLARLRVEARNADLAVSKSDGRPSAAVGDGLTYTIRATNRGPADVAGARVTDTFPAGVSGCSWTCAPQGVGASCDTPPPAGSVASLDAQVSLPASTSAVFQVSCTVAPSALCTTIRNQVRIDPPETVLEVDEADNTASDTTRVGFSAVTVTKEAPETVVLPSGANATVTDTITVRNEGLCPAIEVRVTDVHGPGDPRSPSGCVWTCEGESCPSSTGAGLVDDTLFGLSAGAEAIFQAACTVPAGVPGETVLQDTVTAVGPDNPAMDTAETVVVADSVSTSRADLALRLEVADPGGPEPEIEAGGTFTLGATVENVGQATAEVVTLRLALPPPPPQPSQVSPPTVESVTVSPSGSCAGDLESSLLCSLPDLPPGATATVEAVLRSAAAGCDALEPVVVVIAAEAGFAPPSPEASDPDPFNNLGQVGVRIRPPADLGGPVDLSLVKALAQSSSPPIVAGGPVAFTVQVRNVGPNTACNAQVTESLPPGLQNVTWTCAPSDGANCTLQGSGDLVDAVDLPPGETATYTVTATVAGGVCGTLTNVAGIASLQPNVETEPSDNAVSVPFLVVPGMGTCTPKTVSPPAQVEGGDITYTVQIVHGGPGVFGGPGNEFEDLVPTELTVVGVSADRGTAMAVANFVTWDGTLNPGEAVTITIFATVNPATEGLVICNQGELLPSLIPTDDPGEPGLEDPTCLAVVAMIPTLSPALLVVMALLLVGLGWRRLRRG